MSPTESVRNYSTPPLRTRGSLVKLTIFAQFVPKMTFLALALAPHTRPGLRARAVLRLPSMSSICFPHWTFQPTCPIQITLPMASILR